MLALAAVLSFVAQAEIAPESWRETATATGDVLSLGELDNAMIQIRCLRPGVLRADLAGLYTGEGPQPHRVTVQSARTRASYRLLESADDAGRFSAEIPATAPVMASFQRTGRLNFQARNVHLEGDAASPAEILVIAGFLARCRG
jgi:hypothetical protein